jgi:tau tubulin kinase
LKMLTSIENTHAAGIVHRDIKPTNFVRGDPSEPDQLYLIDFGLAKQHLDARGEVLPTRTQTEFRGTVPYASLASHFKKELGRKDDLWSFFFILLELLDQKLPWS